MSEMITAFNPRKELFSETESFLQFLKEGTTFQVEDMPKQTMRLTDDRFIGCKTSREFTKLLKYTDVKCMSDVECLLNTKFRHELNYYLMNKPNLNNESYNQLLEDLSEYLQLN